MATVLLSVLAATITIIVVRQALMLTSIEGGRRNVANVQQQARDVQLQFERELAKNPQFYLTSTFAYERPRRCPVNPKSLDSATATTMSPLETSLSGQYVVPLRDASSDYQSQPWPALCGSSWTYPEVGTQQLTGVNISGTYSVPVVAAGKQWTAKDFPLRAEVLPPNPYDPALTLRVLSFGGKSESGLELRYLRSSASQWTLYSSSSINAASPTSSLALSAGASVYSAGQVLLPASDASFMPDVVVAAGGVVGASSTAQLSTATDAQKAQYTLEALRASLSSTTSTACPEGAQPPADTTAPWASSDGVATPEGMSYLCLQEGRQVVNPLFQPGSTDPTTKDFLTTIPSNVTGWMLVLNETGSTGKPTISAYYTTSTLRYVTDCLVACDPQLTAASLAASGADPYVPYGQPGSPWEHLGDFYYPVTGIVQTDADTFVSGPSTPSTAAASLTIVAGSATKPADLLLAGNLSTTSSSLVGLVASRSVLVPYVAAGPGGTLDVTASLVALGLGSTPPAFHSLPARAVPGSSAAQALHLTGSLASDGISDIPSLSTLSITPDERLVNAQPPLLPSFGSSWRQNSTRALSSFDVCPASMDQDASRASCLGLW